MSTLTNYVKKSDASIFYLFNKKLHCNFLNILMGNITHLGSVVFAVIFPLIFIIWPKYEVRKIGIDLALNLFLSQAIVHSIKRLVRRPRPYKILKKVLAVNPPSCKYSFPSGHTNAAFVLTFVLAYHMSSLALLFLLLASLVGLSRIYLGFHYPTDVFIGVIIAYLSYTVYFKII
ncbi:MAG: phosphatase PAP2 family protein [Clostridia bacterium]|nr:phosphatase PAP2 family protein [Clostridia bacterium]